MFGLSARVSVVAVLAATLCQAQPPTALDDVAGMGGRRTNPILRHKVEPTFTDEAREQGIEGRVVVGLSVDENGRPVDITVLSPLGFGLDEKACEAVAKWRFDPGTLDGEPTKAGAIVAVNFGHVPPSNASGGGQRQSMFALALRALTRLDSSNDAIRSAVKVIERLSHEKFVPAMYLVGTWQLSGTHVPADITSGLRLVQAAAEKHYGPAIYDVALRRIEGRDLQQDVRKGLDEMEQAARLGSGQAQYYLGHRFEKGDSVPADPDRAVRYFRMCAARGTAECRYRLARLLLDTQGKRESHRVQAVAWLQLAAEQGLPEAKELEASAAVDLSPAEVKAVKSLKDALKGS